MPLKGTITALITPFIDDKLDEEGLIKNIRYQISQGVSGILPLGSTGEAPTLSPAEQEKIISIAVKEAKGKVPIWVGTGAYCTRQTIEKTKKAKDLGADIVLIVNPYYNKPTQEGLFRHFEAISNAVDIPIVIYNNPARCCINIEASTLIRLANLPNLKGLKESTDNLSHTTEYIHRLAQEGLDFAILSGDDVNTLPMMSLGARGVISVVSNLVPQGIVSLVKAASAGNYNEAREIHYGLLPLVKAAFLETNPIPIKAAMSLCGMAAGECRLPLYKMSPENLHKLKQVLITMNLIKS